MNRTLRNSIGPTVGLLLFTVAVFILHRQLQTYHYHDVELQLRQLPRENALLAFVLTILSYIVLTGYDFLALRYIKQPLSYGKVALASFLGYVFSNNIGLAALGATAVRFRLYSAWGISPIEIAKIVAFCILTFWIGVLTIGGLTFIVEPIPVPWQFHFPFLTLRPLGIIFLGIVAVYLVASAFRTKPFHFKQFDIALPSTGLSLAQITVSAVDWATAGSVLFVLLPPSPDLSYPNFLAVFLFAQVVGLISHVPGGLGVFETVVLIFLSPILPPPAILSSLVAYRLIYYLIPLAVGSLLLAGHELSYKYHHLQTVFGAIGKWMPELAPRMLALTTFVSGAILLFSGSTPAKHSRLSWIADFLPLPVLEISHFLGSVVGVCLLILARSLQRRLDIAYYLTLGLLTSGIVFSLLKGFDYEEALILSIMFLALLPCRRYFYRRASLLNQWFTWQWIAAIVLVLMCSASLVFFSYKHIEYSNELWWHFSVLNNAPRSLRAAVGVFIVILFVMIKRLLAPRPPMLSLPTTADLETARTIVNSQPSVLGNLALLADKYLFFNQDRTAFIMYAIQGRSWIALGDPIGATEKLPDLAWDFYDFCDRHGGWTVFYQVPSSNLSLYLDIGLMPLKIGEEARVRLDTFSLEGGSSRRKHFRNTRNKLQKTGYTFELRPREDVPSLLPSLKATSEAWLAHKNTREKGFSLGFFDDAYLLNFPVALIRTQSQIVAFANLWAGTGNDEFSVDLMRFHPDAPEGVMDYLFIELLLWGKERGYHWFNLGMAPLSGLEDRLHAPLWNRLAALVFRFGEHFYNFQGLRQYKEKFDPTWEPKYLACPGGLILPQVLANIASLTSGGTKGVISK